MLLWSARCYVPVLGKSGARDMRRRESSWPCSAEQRRRGRSPRARSNPRCQGLAFSAISRRSQRRQDCEGSRPDNPAGHARACHPGDRIEPALVHRASWWRSGNTTPAARHPNRWSPVLLTPGSSDQDATFGLDRAHLCWKSHREGRETHRVAAFPRETVVLGRAQWRHPCSRTALSFWPLHRCRHTGPSFCKFYTG